MTKVNYFSKTGEKKDDLKLEVAKRYASFNDALFAQVLRVEQNNLFQKSGHIKTKGEVAGGGKKPWKQKGTGRARAGSNRSPLWRGGGVTFGPNGVKPNLTINKKMRQLAFLQALVKRSEDLVVIEKYEIKSAKTKDAAILMDKVAPAQKSFLIIQKDEIEQMRPFVNLPLSQVASLNDILLNDLTKKAKFIFSQEAFSEVSKKLEDK